MNTRDIVRKAWQITQVHLKKLIWYGSVPAFLSIVVTSVYLGYQYEAFKNSTLFVENPGDAIKGNVALAWDFISTNPGITATVVVIAILFLFAYVIIPPIFNGTLIEALHRIKNFKTIEGATQVGVRKFFPMFEFRILLGAFSITTLFSESSFVLRWWGQNVLFFILPIFLFIAMVGLIISFLFTYVEYFIVLKGESLLKAVGSSVVLVISNLRKTILVFILMLLIGAKIILNLLLILLIPMLIVTLGSYFASILLGTIGFAIIGILALGLILVASYLMGLFNVFATTVWVLTYCLLTESQAEAIQDEDLGGNQV